MPDHKVHACARVGDRDYAHYATDESSQFGAIRLIKALGAITDGPVTHWSGSPSVDPGFLFLAPAVLGAMYPLATIATDGAGNVTASEVGGGLLAAIGPFQQPQAGVWTTVQTPEQFHAALGLTPIEGSLGGDEPSDAALASAQANEPFVPDPKTVIDPQVAADLFARLVAALTQGLPLGARNEMSSQLGLGGALASAFLNKYGSTGI